MGSAARTPLAVATVSLVGLLIPFAVVLLSGQYEPIELMRVGEQSKAAPLVEARYGAGVLTQGDAGYDGAYFWAAADGLPDLDAAAEHLDDAPYRLQRILPSAIAALAGGGDASAVVLVLLSVVGAALCTGALADLAVRHGRSARLGFLAVVPLAFSIGYSTGEPLAFGLGLLGLCLADREQHALAVLCITLGSLARESVAVFGLGVLLAFSISAWRRRRPLRLPLLAAYLIPLAVDLLWAAWLRSRFESGEVINRIVPFGILDASGPGIVLGVAVMAVGLAGCWLWRDVEVVWGTVLGFTVGVLTYYGPLFLLRALPRVSAPALMFGLAGLLDLWAGRRPVEDQTPVVTPTG
jgi:hypothetical protein